MIKRLQDISIGIIIGIILSGAVYTVYIFTQSDNGSADKKDDVIEIIDNREKELSDYADKTKKLSDRIDDYLINNPMHKRL
jgi:hypothetical protein